MCPGQLAKRNACVQHNAAARLQENNKALLEAGARKELYSHYCEFWIGSQSYIYIYIYVCVCVCVCVCVDVVDEHVLVALEGYTLANSSLEINLIQDCERIFV